MSLRTILKGGPVVAGVLAASFLLGPPAEAAPPVAILGATIHTMGPQGEIRNGAILIQDGTIRAVGASIAIPAGATRIDASGKVITPGLFDSLSRIGLVEVNQVEATGDAQSDDDRITAALNVVDALNPASSLIAINRIEGLTYALVAPEAGKSLIAGQAAVIQLGGGEMVLRAPAAMFAVLGEAGAEKSGGSRAGAILLLREALADARDWADHRADWDKGARRSYALSRLDLEALGPVARGEVPLIIRAHRASDLLAAIRFAKEEKLKLILAGADEGWEVAAEIAAAGVPVVLNPLDDLPGSFEALGARLDNAARLKAAGVRIAFATFDAHNARNLRQAAGNAVANGLPWIDGLAAMTIEPAKIWGVADRLGSLEAGKEATLVIWDGDPLEVTTFPEHVIVRGAELPQRSRQIELRDRYRTLPVGPTSPQP
ncbi:MAG TPA: amidohydrolase family protein [Thermoanaerobaculia bacterium]|jgi:imidazolonepropionase-like amidohydrolase|nr:amidohydrolase family protein [Thermoanaerobaculia bacterium]